MGDWVHCNKCLLRPLPGKKVDYKLTSCGHILCLNCMKSSAQSDNKCLVCSQKCATVPLTSPLPPEVAALFTDPMVAIKKFKQTFKFQEENHLKLYKAHLFKAEVDLKELDKKYERLKREIQVLRQALHHRQAAATTSSIAQPHSRGHGTDMGGTNMSSVTPFYGRRQCDSMISRQIRLQTPLTLSNKKPPPTNSQQYHH